MTEVDYEVHYDLRWEVATALLRLVPLCRILVGDTTSVLTDMKIMDPFDVTILERELLND